MLSRLIDRPIRIVLKWQLIATSGLTLAFGAYSGAHGALSAALGGLVTVAAGAAFALLGARARRQPAQFALFGMLRAEAVKIGLTVLLLWLVLKLYDDVVVVNLIVSFVISTLIFSMAAFVRDN
jgi:ATP synthase protein I